MNDIGDNVQRLEMGQARPTVFFLLKRNNRVRPLKMFPVSVLVFAYSRGWDMFHLEISENKTQIARFRRWLVRLTFDLHLSYYSIRV